ncbi:MAG: CoA activase [Chloroflexi bacterium RBG_13_53_26]|nr:MAG: CoA activase [Chloroflexi bacterium RBG_13_53_26]
MIVGGCDIGSATGKAVVMKDGEIVSYAITPSTVKPEVTARKAMDEALQKAGLSKLEDLDYVVGTGYGRLKVEFANENVSEISCHSRGAQWLLPTARTVIDIGGQDCKVMSVTDKGKVLEFVMNDKCAAGTGKFYEAMARTLQLSLEELSTMGLEAKKPAAISSQCSVFAESEVITLINEGVELADIIAGLNNSVAGRLSGMVGRVGVVEDVVVTGGCAKNEGLARALEQRLKVKIKRLPMDPQIAGAVGAAVIAAEKVAQKAQTDSVAAKSAR